MSSTVAFIDRAIRSAGIPIISVSVGRASDKQTWRIQFDPSATPEQRDQAQSLVDAFTLPTPQELADDVVQREVNRKELRAVALGLHECIPNPTMTKAQLTARILAIYRSL